MTKEFITDSVPVAAALEYSGFAPDEIYTSDNMGVGRSQTVIYKWNNRDKLPLSKIKTLQGNLLDFYRFVFEFKKKSFYPYSDKPNKNEGQSNEK